MLPFFHRKNLRFREQVRGFWTNRQEMVEMNVSSDEYNSMLWLFLLSNTTDSGIQREPEMVPGRRRFPLPIPKA